jgi:ankyrin repeat protein
VTAERHYFESQQAFDQDGMPSETALVDCCLGLVVIERETSTIRMTHFTLQEYFDNHRDALFPSGHTTIAKACLTYLAFEHTSDLEEIESSSPLIEYIGRNMGHHLRKGSDTTTDEMVRNLLNDENKFSILNTFLGRLISPYHPQTTIFKLLPLHWVAFFGVFSITQSILEATDDINVTEAYKKMTPLALAAKNGHEAIIKLLVNTPDVDLNSRDEYDRTPLALAVENGREAIVKVLVDTPGVDLNSKGQLGRTPLALAAKNGHEAVVKLLVSTPGVGLNSRDKGDRTPFAWAASNGHEAIIKVLVDTPGVDLNSKGQLGRTPLALAAKDGHEAIIKLLVNTPGIDINSKDKDDRTPLALAVEKGREAIVKLLVSTPGVDLNSRDKFGQTALSCAEFRDYDAIVRMLQSALDRHRSTDFIVAAT